MAWLSERLALTTMTPMMPAGESQQLYREHGQHDSGGQGQRM
jgi:hypothetical protein